MVDFLLLRNNYVYITLILVLLSIAIIESILIIFGKSFFGGLEMLIPPTTHKSSQHIENTYGEIIDSQRLQGKIPLIVPINIFLTSFSGTGLLTHYIAIILLDFHIPWFYSVIPSAFIAVSAIIVGNKILRPLLYKGFKKIECSSAVSSNTFIGQYAIITQGIGTKGMQVDGLTGNRGNGSSDNSTVDQSSIADQVVN